MVSPGKKSGIFMGCGSVLVVLGAVMVVFWPPLFISQLQRMLILTPTSTSFDIWKETPIPMYLECFMFNITNSDDILAGKNVTLRVEQLGPYVYRESHSKVNLTWNDNSTVTFYNQRYWHFVPEMSSGNLSDEIVSINPIVATVAYTLRNQRPVAKLAVDVFLRMFHDSLFLSANVSSWLFDGIEDPVLDIASHFPDLPIIIPYDKFGWFYDRNGSLEYDGSFTMNTGESDFSMIGNIEKWRWSNRTLYRDECGEVKGSTGELWAPEFGQPEVTIFASDICSYMILSKNQDVSIEGISGVEYAANKSVFDNGFNYPHTACYCSEDRSDCLTSGALNVSACRFGAPAFVSLPHFLDADPEYPSKIDGLNATEEMRFRLSLEMLTGMPLGVAAQLQINLLLRHVSFITINNMLPDPDTLVPMFWFRQELAITPEYAALARQALRLRYWTPWAFYVITLSGLCLGSLVNHQYVWLQINRAWTLGVILLMLGVAYLMRKLLKSPDTTPIMEEHEREQAHAHDS